MNIAHIIPGSGGSFYCGNCLRDSKIFHALRSQGQNAIKIPMYLPLFSNDHENGKTPVFYGAINIYLKQLYPIFRYAPKWFESILNSKPMLKLASGMAGSTRARGLEEMTISMLMGEHGKQKDELDKLVNWLEHHFKPDVIHISNALLLGLAHKLKERLGVPIVCSLQDEDVWVDVMSPESAKMVWDLMREKAKDVDRFIAVSGYYTTFMKEKLGISDSQISTLYLGVDPNDYHFINATQKPRNIGFISRLCPENGLDILIDAYINLKQREGNEDVNLLLTGGHTNDDNIFIKEQKIKLKKANLLDSVEFIHNFDELNRNHFFNRVMLLSVPVPHGEAFGIYLTEAMASGTPIVQPALGAFPEIVELSGGGIIYGNNTPEELADSLHNLLNDQEKVSELSENARIGVNNHFNINTLSKDLSDIYGSLNSK
jgi:glycosyltransferase involved in cell wall biosynthesis